MSGLNKYHHRRHVINTAQDKNTKLNFTSSSKAKIISVGSSRTRRRLHLPTVDDHTHTQVISGRRTGTLVVDDALEAPDHGVPPRPLVRGGHLVAQDALEQRGDGGAVGARRPRQAAQVRHVRLRLKQHRRHFKQMLFFNRHTYDNSFF